MSTPKRSTVEYSPRPRRRIRGCARRPSGTHQGLEALVALTYFRGEEEGGFCGRMGAMRKIR